MSEATRRLTYRFLTLSYQDRMKILISLDLLLDEDEGKMDATILHRVLQSATDVEFMRLEEAIEKKRTKEPDEIIRLEHLKRVRLEPDDFLVIESPLRLTDECMTRLADLVKSVFGEDRRVIIMEEGMKFGVVSPQGKLALNRGDLERVPMPYHTDGPGNLICPHCKTLTNKHYAGVPNLPCWKCGKSMDPKAVDEKTGE